MNSNAIYIKTTAGEEAVQQRVHVIQRNVRMVLILVDGHSTVDDLSRKIGNLQLVESALSELEAGGFIELRDKSLDSPGPLPQLADVSKRQTEKNKEFQRRHEPKREKQATYAEQVKFEPSSPHSGGFSGSPSNGAPASNYFSFNTQTRDGFLTSQFFLSSDEPVSQRNTPPKNSIFSRGNDDIVSTSLSPSPFQRDVDSVQVKEKSSVMERLKKLWPNTAEQEGKNEMTKSKPVDVKPVQRRTARKKSRWPGWPMTCLLGILLLVISSGLTIILFPYDKFVNEAESALTTAIGRSVKLGAMRVDVYPIAGLTLENVRIGEGKNDEVRVGKIQLQPDPMTLFSSKKMIRHVMLNDLTLSLGKTNNLAEVVSMLTNPGSSIGVQKISFAEMDLHFAGIRLKGMQAEIRPNPGNGFQTLALQSSDKSLSIVLRPIRQKIEVALDAYAWNPYEGSKLLVDSASLTGQLEGDVLSIDTADIRLADGVIQGRATINDNGNSNIAGDISFERLNTTRLSEIFGLARKFSGDAVGKMHFQATASSWASIFSSIHAAGDFSINRGNISGVDFIEAARRTSGLPVQGGMTSFEQLNGKMNLSPEKNQFSELTMNSGLVRSTGHVDVAQGGKLNGKFELQIQGSVNQTRVPIAIEGTITSPVVQVRKN